MLPTEIYTIFEKTLKIKPIHDVVLFAHGEDDQIKFDIDKSITTENYKEVLSCLKQLPSTGSIVLQSCSTGNNIAKKIYDFTNRTIFAPLIPVGVVSSGVDFSDRLYAYFNYLIRGFF